LTSNFLCGKYNPTLFWNPFNVQKGGRRKMDSIIGLSVCLGIIIIVIFAAKMIDKSRIKKLNTEKRAYASQFAQRHVEIIEESKNIINKSKKLDTITHRFEVILNNIEKLKSLAKEYQYPDITNPPPGEIEAFYINEKDKFIKDFILEEIDKNIQKAKAVTRKSTKISLLDKSIMLICDGKDLVKNEDKIKELSNKENEIKDLINQINKEG
jgi:hypothetical protein